MCSVVTFKRTFKVIKAREMLASSDLCSGCSACKAICPKDAIIMAQDKDGFLYPQINEVKCIGCHLCEKICPVLHPGDPDVNPTVYAAYTKDKELRLASSSGGVFSELAKPIIETGGVVFGCVWQKPELIAIHAKAETLEDLAEMRGSKYVQSDIRNTYREAKEALLQGRQVLYSGTPCQIAGLNSFLGKKYDNLLMVEIICHSTPSPAVFEKFKAEERKKYGEIVHIYFRDKMKQGSSLRYDIKDKESIFLSLGGSAFGRAFFAHLCSRMSCYNCQAKQGRSGADISIGDAWGVDKYLPVLKMQNGVSLVALHTSRGEVAFQQVITTCECHALDPQMAFRDNPYYLTSTPYSPNRARFLRDYRTSRSLTSLLNRILIGPLPRQFYIKLRALARRMCRRLRRFISISLFGHVNA